MIFRLVHQQARDRAVEAVRNAPDEYEVRIKPPTRNGDQNAKFHAICGDLERSKFKHAGKSRTAKEWKVLLVSGHAMATNEAVEVVPGLEGEYVNIRESTALMSKKRSASLIEYTIAFCAQNDIDLLRKP